MTPAELSVAFLIIGNEVLSGRTQEKNLSTLAGLLNAQGLRLREVRVIPDVQEVIVSALNALRATHDYVFTSGGIGPTHDDITTAAVAAAFARPVCENQQAVERLQYFYDQRDLPFTASRRRMTRMPETATIIVSDFPGAPAYRIDNVIVCAGVPSIFQAMAAAAIKALPVGNIWHSATLQVSHRESEFADTLATIASAFPTVEIGSYPRDDDGVFSCQIVFSCPDKARLEEAQQQFIDYLTAVQVAYQ